VGIIEILLIGLVVGFLFYECTGISAGGVIAPAYLAMFVHQPNRIFVTVLIALAVFAIVRWLSARLIIYGRRRLLIAILLGFTLKLLFDKVIQPLPVARFDLRSIGYLIPGLIGNEMYRQKVVPTILGLAIVTIVVYLITLLA
jgi:poly-gamma-glutamate biosynthesis protein PgsC/CapC